MTAGELVDLLAEYPGDQRPVIVIAGEGDAISDTTAAYDVVDVERYEDAVVIRVESRN